MVSRRNRVAEIRTRSLACFLASRLLARCKKSDSSYWIALSPIAGIETGTRNKTLSLVEESNRLNLQRPSQRRTDTRTAAPSHPSLNRFCKPCLCAIEQISLRRLRDSTLTSCKLGIAVLCETLLCPALLCLSLS